MSLLQVVDMVLYLFFAQRTLPRSNHGHNLANLLGLDERLSERADVVRRVSRIDHALRHFRLECAIAGKRHYTMKIRLANAEVVRLREELEPTIKQMKGVMARVKEAYAETK